MRLRIWIALFILLGCTVIFLLFRPLTRNSIPTRINLKNDLDIAATCDLLTEKKVLNNASWVRWSATLLGIKEVKSGSYLIQPKENLVQLLRRIHGSRQTPVKMIIGNERVRIRTLAQFAGKMERFAFTRADSLEWIQFLSSEDSLRPLGLNPHNVLTRMMPYTYEIYWTESPRKLMEMLERSWDRYWNENRKEKAKRIGLSPTEVSILASIVEEETQHAPDRRLIASTYLNRIRIGMRLQADPTAKYTSGDFDAKRVTFAHLRYESPYNTYLVKGLPPGPICLPSLASIEAVLDAPQTDYLYFVASHRFDGTSIFSSDYAKHLQHAKRYQEELTKRMKTSR